ncbi:MAG: hypothetical protein ABMA26_17625 [Limisphaerales bacterium]
MQPTSESNLPTLFTLKDASITRMRAVGIEQFAAAEKERAFRRSVSNISP